MRDRMIVLLAACVFLTGCQSMHPISSSPACGCGDLASNDEPTAATALAQADRFTSRSAAVLTAIDSALNICAVNIENADQTGYRATVASVGGDGSIRVYPDPTQGSLNDTNRNLDIGISGDGFFRIKVIDPVANGYAYTRNGNFFLSHNGELVLGVGNGYKLEPPIMIPNGATDIEIGETGIVEYKEAGATDDKIAGQLVIHQFVNQEGLRLLRDGVYVETEQSGPPIDSRPGEDGAGVTLQGFLEASNVIIERERLRMKYLHSWRNSVLEAAEASARAPRPAGRL